jgi:tryptophan synthase alpha chain
MTDPATFGNRIAETFETAKAENRIALLPYVTIGYPTLERSKKLIKAIVEAGADGLELGVPFSDPLADGATVQRTSQVALDQGTTLSDALNLVAELRAEGVTVPLVLMGYTNPFYQYGLEKLAAKAAEVGVDGFIVPDLPAEESDEWATPFRANGRDLIFFVAPTSTPSRLKTTAEKASGFIYCVSLTGVTGAREAMASDLGEYIGRVRAATDLPLVIGFGVSTPAHVQEIAQIADGAIVASAMINHLDTFSEADEVEAAIAFVQRMKSATTK